MQIDGSKKREEERERMEEKAKFTIPTGEI